MRMRIGFAFCVPILVLLLVLHKHVGVLTETARTYGSFYRWLDAHPATLYRFSKDQNVAAIGNTTLAPRILHHVFLSNETTLPARYTPAVDSCRALHADWSHRLWTTADAADFMRQHYPQIYPHYMGYKQTIQRANVLRYALLHRFGGVYLDIDVQCLQPLDSLLHLPFISPAAYPAGVNNAFILARPNHGFLQSLIDDVPGHDSAWGLPYVQNMLSTGCMYFSNQWMKYVRSLRTSTTSEIEADRVFVLADENGNLDAHMLRGVTTTPLFHHGGASSWHSWDAGLIILVGKHYHLLILGFVLVLVALLACWHVIARRRSMRHSPNLGWITQTPNGRHAMSQVDEPRFLRDAELYKQS